MSQEITQFERFKTLTIDRKDLKNAEYNPRKIKKDNRDRLKARIEKVGLLSPIVWNKQTGNIVSGHQRIAILDSLMRKRDYQLTVAVVDLDPQTEKEQAVFFNNMSAMGEWDLEKLADLFEADVNMISAGFSKQDMELLFEADPADIFAEEIDAQGPPRREASPPARAPSDPRPDDDVGETDLQPKPSAFDDIDEEEDPEAAEPTEGGYFERGDKVREAMQHRKRRAAVSAFREDTDFYFVAVFRSKAERDAFLADYGVEEGQFINGNVLREAINGSTEG